MPASGKPTAVRPSVGRADFEALVRRHYRPLLAYAVSLTRRRDAAEDLVQDALVVACKNLQKYEPGTSFAAWTREIVRRKYLKWAHRRRHAPLEPAVLEAIEYDHPLAVRAEDPFSALRACLGALPSHLGECVRPFYLQQQSCAKIAEHLQTSVDSVKKRLQRARAALAECMRSTLGKDGG